VLTAKRSNKHDEQNNLTTVFALPLYHHRPSLTAAVNNAISRLVGVYTIGVAIAFGQYL